MSEEDVQVRFGASVDGAISGIHQIIDSLEGIGGPVGSLMAIFVELGEVIIATFAIEKVMDFVEAIAEVGAKIEHLAVALGMTATEMSTFVGVAGLMDVGADQLGASMTRMERNMATAASGSGPAVKAFADLHVKVTDAAGNMRSMADLLPEVAEGFKNNANHMQAVNDLMAIGGRGMKNMIPIFAEGKEGLAAYSEKIKETGDVMNKEMAEGFEKTAIKGHLLHDSIDGLKLTIAEAFKPSVDSLLESLTGFVQAMNKSAQTGGALNYVLEALVIAWDAVVTAIDAVITFVVELVQTFDLGVKTIVAILGILDKVIGDVLSGHWIDAYNDTQKGLNELGVLWSNYFKELAKQETAFNARLAQTWSNVGLHGVNTADRTPDKKTEASGKPAPNLGALEAQAAAEEKLTLAKIAREEQADKLAFALGKETIQQLYDAEVSAEAQKFEVKKTFLQKKLALEADDVAKRIATLGEIKVLEVQHETTLDKLYAEKLDKQKQMDAQALASYITTQNDRLKVGLHALDEDYNNHLITIEEKIAGEKELTNVILDEELKRLRAAQATYAVGGKDYQAYQEKIEAITREKSTRITALNDQMGAHWTKVSDKVASHFGSALTTMLTTTQTWQQQVVNILNRLVETFVTEVVEPMISSWVRGEIMKTTATTAGSATRAAAGATENSGFFSRVGAMLLSWLGLETSKTAESVGGAGARAAAQAAETLAGITAAKALAIGEIPAYTGVAAMGAAASVAPIPFIGPELAATAFAAMQTLGVTALGIASAAGGMVVNEDQLAMVHKNEMILPSHLSSGITNIINSGGGKGNGGGNFTYSPTVNSPEAKSLHQMLTDESQTMRAWISNQMRDGHLTVGA